MSSNTVTASEYDVVKVDLSDGRDYPIYIGDSFSEEEAGKLLRSHVKGNRALLITNDRISPLYLEKYESLLKEDGKIQVGTFMC
jgi:3-dehydroquinate synthase